MRGLRLVFGFVVLLAVVGMHPAAAQTERTVTVNANGPPTAPYQFAPATRNVEAGDSVVWNNNTAVAHTATADDGSFNVSIPTGPGTSSSAVTIEGPTRDVAYHCNIHAYMHGVIHVTALVVVTTTTTRPTTTTTARTTTSRATTTSRVSSTTSSTFTTETLALDTSTSEETTTTAGQVALKSTGGHTNAGAVAVLVVAIGAILGGGGYLLYRLRSGRF